MVIDGVRAQRLHETVEGERRRSLKDAVRAAAAAHAVDDVGAVAVNGHHFGDGINIVLQVGVDAHQCVGPRTGRRQSGQEGRLVAGIGGQVEAVDPTAGAVELTDEGPGAVVAAVVDIEDKTARPDRSLGDEVVDQGAEAAVGLFEHSFFAEARNDDGKEWRR